MQTVIRVSVFVILLIGFQGCKNNPNDNKSIESKANDTLPDSTEVTQIENDVEFETDTANWVYSQNEDKMTGKQDYFAEVSAKELLMFDFPYDGGSQARLIIRYTNKNEILLVISKGQFKTNYDGTSVRIRFDEEPPANYTCSEPSDRSSNVLFINSASKLIKKMKSAKTMLIEAEFYQEGNRIMEFDVSNLQWSY
jgi:hypothetical protein